MGFFWRVLLLFLLASVFTPSGRLLKAGHRYDVGVLGWVLGDRVCFFGGGFLWDLDFGVLRWRDKQWRRLFLLVYFLFLFMCDESGGWLGDGFPI